MLDLMNIFRLRVRFVFVEFWVTLEIILYDANHVSVLVIKLDRPIVLLFKNNSCRNILFISEHQ